MFMPIKDLLNSDLYPGEAESAVVSNPCRDTDSSSVYALLGPTQLYFIVYPRKADPAAVYSLYTGETDSVSSFKF